MRIVIVAQRPCMYGGERDAVFHVGWRQGIVGIRAGIARRGSRSFVSNRPALKEKGFAKRLVQVERRAR